MIDQALRAPKRALLAPVARALGDRDPLLVTGLGLAAGGIAALAAALGRADAALALWLLNRALDGLDGELARLHGRAGDLGGYLDLLADHVVYAALPIALASAFPGPGVHGALAWMLAAFYVNAASWTVLSAILEKRGRGAAATGQSTSVAMPAGLVEGAETILLFTLFLLLPERLALLFGVTAALVAVTAAQRLAWAARTLRRPAPPRPSPAPEGDRSA